MNQDLHPLLVAILEEGTELKSMKLGLERMELFDQRLGFPSKAFASIHVAGTNGKGSVSTKIATALEASGKKVGLYTSPHLLSYRERVRINSRAIADATAGALLSRILSVLPEKPTYFELLTLLACLYFAENSVEVAVFEVGMGGRLDATNILTPLLSIITSISLDHTRYLGKTLEEIAFEKGGIIKPKIPVLLGAHAKPLDVFQRIAHERESCVYQVIEKDQSYEEENRQIARNALDLLPYRIDEKSLQLGLEKTPPCRFHILRLDPPVLVDVGHNPDGLERVFKRIHETFRGYKIRVVIAFSEDKEIDASLEVVKKYADALHLTQASHMRAFPVDQMQEFGERDPIAFLAFEKAYTLACKNQEVLLITGTFFIMREAFEFFGATQDLEHSLY